MKNLNPNEFRGQDCGLLKYVAENFKIDSEVFDYLKDELNLLIYSFGMHFTFTKEEPQFPLSRYQSIPGSIKKIAQRFYPFLKIFIQNIKKTPYSKYGPSPEIIENGVLKGKKILCDAYFTINDELKKIGLVPLHSIWFNPNDRFYEANLSKECSEIITILSKGTFKQLLSKQFAEKIKQFKESLKNKYIGSDIRAAILPNDSTFFQKMTTNIFKEINRPSIIFLHGLPGRYNLLDDNRTDYLIVWGEKIRQNYVKTGFNSNKILVSGHPLYQNFTPTTLRFSFQDILIIPNVILNGQEEDRVRLVDRGNAILYLYQIQHVLQALGIKKVRLRPHPSSNINWYMKFLNGKFFVLDSDDLFTSLKKSTLVIGAGSTVLLEAIYHGVNYVLYNPILNGKDMVEFDPVPPFDGSDPKIPVAKNENELKEILREKKMIDPTVFQEYITIPFDISYIKTIID